MYYNFLDNIAVFVQAAIKDYKEKSVPKGSPMRKEIFYL
jgi:hypothetical protein